MTDLSRRSFAKMLAGAGAFAAMSQMGRYAAHAAATSEFRATVGIFLYGGNDSWNMIVPTDDRYAGYAAARGAKMAIPKTALVPLAGSTFGLHPAMASLKPVWEAGGMSAVLNTGTLYVPMNKSMLADRPDLCPTSLMSHADEQQHWQGLRARDASVDGFLGRLNEKMDQGSFVSPVMTFTTPDLAIQSRSQQPLTLTLTPALTRNGANTGSPYNYYGAREVAMSVFAKPTDNGAIFAQTTSKIGQAYALADPLRALVGAGGSTDAFFVDPANGQPLYSGIAKQLASIARMIARHELLDHNRQAFFASHGGFDTHSAQLDATITGGTHAALLKDLALAMAAFHRAMSSLGLENNVTAFTMSDFGRTLRPNGSFGTDHAWGGNHLVIGGGLRPNTIHGSYPDTTLGGVDDADGSGRFIPTISQEEYIGAIMRWHGVSAGDMAYVLPNWQTWSSNGRGPVPFFT